MVGEGNDDALPVSIEGPIELTDTPRSSADVEQAERTDVSRGELASRVNRINLIWEYTQAFLASIVVLTFVILALQGNPIPRGLGNVLFLVIGFYFGRTNHARPGGGTTTGGGP